MATDGQLLRFWAKVRISPSLEKCWNWTANRRSSGYGLFTVSTGHTITASRFAWIVVNGSIPDGLLVCHRCDNPSCCNPTHLFLGTHRDNVNDMYQKGRGFQKQGKPSGKPKLNPEQVLEIRTLFGRISSREIARRFGVCHETIGKIFRGETWRHL